MKVNSVPHFPWTKTSHLAKMFPTLMVKSPISVIWVKQLFLVLFIFDWSSYFKASPVCALTICRSLSRYVAGKNVCWSILLDIPCCAMSVNSNLLNMDGCKSLRNISSYNIMISFISICVVKNVLIAYSAYNWQFALCAFCLRWWHHENLQCRHRR